MTIIFMQKNLEIIGNSSVWHQRIHSRFWFFFNIYARAPKMGEFQQNYIADKIHTEEASSFQWPNI